MSLYFPEPNAVTDEAALRSYENDVLYRGTAAWEGDEDSNADC